MKLLDRFNQLPTQTRWMIILIILLVVMVATRWSYISRTAGSAFSERFVHSTAQQDSLKIE